jgi:hypothetical protein
MKAYAVRNPTCRASELGLGTRFRSVNFPPGMPLAGKPPSRRCYMIGWGLGAKHRLRTTDVASRPPERLVLLFCVGIVLCRNSYDR